MRTDRELLELAAKAVGLINPRYNFNFGRDYEAPTGILHDLDGGRTTVSWNPLTDDGDALRLAVACKINVGPDDEEDEDTITAYRDDCVHQIYWTEIAGGDLFEATRRAIVCCAAEIGEQMP